MMALFLVPVMGISTCSRPPRNGTVLMVRAQLPCPRAKITVRPSGDSRGVPGPPPGMGTVSVLIRWPPVAEYTATTSMVPTPGETPTKSAGRPAAVTPAVVVAGGTPRGAVAAGPLHPVARRNNPAASITPGPRTRPAIIAPPSYLPDP